MKANAYVTAAVAGVLCLAAADWAAAQQAPRRDPSAPTPTPVRVEVPAGGLTFNFSDIDRNNDGNISVEEWNAFVASLQSRLGKTTGGAAAGGTASGAGAKEKGPSR